MHKTIPLRITSAAVATALACLCALAFAMPGIAHAEELAAGEVSAQSEGGTLPLNGKVEGIVSDGEKNIYSFKIAKTCEFIYSGKHGWGGDIAVTLNYPSGKYDSAETMRPLGDDRFRTAMAYRFYLRPGSYSLILEEGAVNGVGDTTPYTLETWYTPMRETHPETASRNDDSRLSANPLALRTTIAGVIDEDDIDEQTGDVYRLVLRKRTRLFVKFSSFEHVTPAITISDTASQTYSFDPGKKNTTNAVVEYRPYSDDNPASKVKSGTTYAYTLDKGTYYITVKGQKNGASGPYAFMAWSKPVIEKVTSLRAKTGKTSISMKWAKMPGATRYQVMWWTKKAKPNKAGVTTNAKKAVKLDRNTKYYFKVRACCNGGWLMRPYVVDRLTDETGNIVEQADHKIRSDKSGGTGYEDGFAFECDWCFH